MSGFDNLLKTDQYIAQNNQFYDAQKYQSDRATAQAIGNIPGKMQQLQMNQQAMEQQKLKSALMGKMVESDLRAQEAAMEQQFHSDKMNQLLMADQVQSSHEDVRMKKNQNAMNEMTMAEMKKASSTDNQTKKSKYISEAVARMGAGPAARAMGEIPYMGNSGWLLRKPDSPEQLEKFIKDNPLAGKGSEGRYTADSAWQMAENIAAKYTTRLGGLEWPDTPEAAQDRRQYDNLRKQGTDYYSGLRGDAQGAPGQPGGPPPERHPASGGQPPGAPGQPPGAPGQPEQFSHTDMMDLLGPAKEKEIAQLSQGAVQQANAAYVHAQRDPEWREMAGIMGEKSFALMAAGIGVAAEDLVKSGRMTSDRASQVVMQSIMRGGSESAMYLSLAGYSEPQIRAWLGRNNSDSAVNSIMGRLNAHITKRKSERKGQSK